MMIYLAWIIVSFTVLQWLIALMNLVLLSRLTEGDYPDKPLVSVLIPARNEEYNIRNILSDLISHDYPNIEVIVFNDQSDDNTPLIVQEMADRDSRIKLAGPDELPPGWTGKNRACHVLSEKASGEYLLFIDADVRLSGRIINNAVAYAKRHKLSLISIFPMQIMITTGEKVTVPNMNFILLSLLPLILVKNAPFPSLAAANGQFMFFDAGIYHELRPHEKMKGSMVEDIEIARYLKREMNNIACLTGDESIRCRMYDGFEGAVKGFSKNIATFFGNSLLLAIIFWLITTFGFLLVLLKLSSFVFITYIIFYLTLRIMISWISEQKVAQNLLFLIPQQVSCGFFIYHAFRNRILKRYTWKGREIKY